MPISIERTSAGTYYLQKYRYHTPKLFRNVEQLEDYLLTVSQRKLLIHPFFCRGFFDCPELRSHLEETRLHRLEQLSRLEPEQ